MAEFDYDREMTEALQHAEASEVVCIILRLSISAWCMTAAAHRTTPRVSPFRPRWGRRTAACAM